MEVTGIVDSTDYVNLLLRSLLLPLLSTPWTVPGRREKETEQERETDRERNDGIDKSQFD